MSIVQISAKDLQAKLASPEKPLLLDVRENNEFDYAHIEGSLHIPMGEVPRRVSEIDASIDCVVVCHHGVRSQQVAEFLQHSGFSNLYNLSGGIDAWSVDCDNTVSRY